MAEPGTVQLGQKTFYGLMAIIVLGCLGAVGQALNLFASGGQRKDNADIVRRLDEIDKTLKEMARDDRDELHKNANRDARLAAIETRLGMAVK
jgi:hypothetical protein